MKKVSITLTGGLGNQLFQIFAGLSLAKGSNLEIEWRNARPRLNQFGEPEITAFEFPENVKFLENRFNAFNSKAIGYLLRVGVNPRFLESSRTYVKVASLFGTLLNILSVKGFRPIRVNVGVGYNLHSESLGKKSVHLVGYFQTYQYIEEYFRNFPNYSLKLKNPSYELVQLRELSNSNNPIVVHLRFGDYKNEPSFGILSKEYYLRSIQELLGLGKFRELWIFSDELGTAKSYFSNFNDVPMRFFFQIGRNTSETLEAMRYGKAYVIGNSTFSWWGAFLSHTQLPPVIAPEPWFIGQVEPNFLIPPSWMRRPGHK